ncbi:hypothetical protein IW150_002222 [Coemansia sp. RSA 2607]|nr:hypothetical protein IW150_002222 [Coemansia sp. RSA 2607]KAJ2385863.1 hypothetical protein GGI05_004563 [Coemansia sp. RSA 2603]
MLPYTESVYSFETRFSTDSADSRVYLLSAIAPDATTVRGTCDTRSHAELDSIMAYQQRTQMHSLVNQRVQLTSAQKHNMQMAELASAVGRMGALRFKNQEYANTPAVVRERRATDIEGFFQRLERLDVDKLHHQQRYSPPPPPAMPAMPAAVARV